MAEKKGFWAGLFGCGCGMSIEEEKADNKKPTKKKGGCCDMQIIEEPGCACGASEEKGSSNCCGKQKL